MNMLSPLGLEPQIARPVPSVPFAWLPLALGFLRRRLPMALAVAFVVTALGFLAVSQQADSFTSGTTLLVDQRRADAFQAGHTPVDAQALNAQLESQVEVLRSYGLVQKTVQRLNLDDSRTDMPPGSWLIGHRPSPLKTMLGLGGPAGPRGDAATRATMAADTLSRMIAVRRVGLTLVIEVSVVSESAEGSARLANGLVEAYVADQLGSKSQATQEASVWLQARLAEIGAQAKKADEAVQDFKRSHHIVATDEGLLSDQQLTGLTTRLASLRAVTTAAKAQLARAQAMLARGDLSGSVMGEGLQSGLLDGLRQRLVDKQRQYGEWRARFGAQHEVVQRLQGEIADLQVGIKGELQRIVSTATNSVDIAQANETAAQAQLDGIVDQSGRVNTDRVQLRALQSEADTYRALNASFLQRYGQAAQDQSFPVSIVEVVSAATPPLQKSGPKRGLVVGGSMVVGLGLGLMAGLVAEVAGSGPMRRSRQRSARGLECIGTVPLLQDSLPRRSAAVSRLQQLFLGGPRPAAWLMPQAGAAGLLRLGVDRPSEPFGVAIAALRRELLQRVGTSGGGRVIACLTLNGGEGTTTIAANLAHCLAIGGHRTVLVDMADGPNGLTRLMGGTGAPAEGFAGRMHQDRVTGLLFRPQPSPSMGLHGAPSPPAQTATATATALVKSLQRKHDFVIIDLPAVERRMPSHDILMEVDDLLMIGSWTEQDEARMAEVPDLAAASAVRCVGIVLTMVPPRHCDVI